MKIDVIRRHQIYQINVYMILFLPPL